MASRTSDADFHTTARGRSSVLPVPLAEGGFGLPNFSMWNHGKEMVGYVLGKKRARKFTKATTTATRPGALEQTDYRHRQARFSDWGRIGS